MPYSERLAREIVNRRLDAGLSQTELAKKADLGSQNFVSLIERNVPESPGFPEMVRIGTVLGMNPNHMAQVAGWWYPPESERRTKHLDPRLVEILQELPEMDRRSREELIRTYYKLLIAYRAEAKPRVSSSVTDEY